MQGLAVFGKQVAPTFWVFVKSRDIEVFSGRCRRSQVVVDPFSFAHVGQTLVVFLRLIWNVGDKGVLANGSGHSALHIVEPSE